MSLSSLSASSIEISSSGCCSIFVVRIGKGENRARGLALRQISGVLLTGGETQQQIACCRRAKSSSMEVQNGPVCVVPVVRMAKRGQQRSVCIIQMAERGANGSTEVHRSPVCVVRMAERERGQRIDSGARPSFSRSVWCWFESLAVVGARALESLAINQGPLQLQHRSESRTVLHLCFNGGVR